MERLWYMVYVRILPSEICRKKKKGGGEEEVGEGQNNTVYRPKIMSEKTTEIHNWGCISAQCMPKAACMRVFLNVQNLAQILKWV